MVRVRVLIRVWVKVRFRFRFRTWLRFRRGELAIVQLIQVHPLNNTWPRIFSSSWTILNNYGMKTMGFEKYF